MTRRRVVAFVARGEAMRLRQVVDTLVRNSLLWLGMANKMLKKNIRHQFEGPS